jgi:hypothetical protein
MDRSSIEYGEVEASTWHEEGGIPVPAWCVLVRYPGHQITYWFQTEIGAQNFVTYRRGG